MAEQITSDNFERYFIQTQESLVDSLEQSNGQVDIAMTTDLNTIKEILSLPGVKYDKDPTTESDAKAVSYVQIPYKILAAAIEQANTAAQSATTAAGNVQTAITAAEQATSDANTATGNANTAAQNANDKASLANSAAGNANTAASNANDKASLANTAAQNADEKAALANTKAGLADTAAQNANDKAALANQAATNADNATTAAQTATSDAEKVNAQLSQQNGAVILTVTSRNGSSTSKEVGFRIAKTYSSVAAMNADASNVEEGRFALIASSVEDPHNAELYVKGATSFTYLTDLSGAQGIKGDTPVMTADSEGVIYADGTKLTEVLKNAVAVFLANEGTSSSAAGSSTRWGQYKSAEAARDTQYSTAESNRDSQYSTAESARDTQYSTAEDSRDTRYGTAEDTRDSQYSAAEGTSSSTAGDGSRWGAYKSAETARNTSYAGEEGSSTSTAGDGTRWGTYKTNETQRQSDFNTAQTSRDTTWTNWFSDSLSTGVRKIWSTWYNATVAAWDSWFGTSTSTGVQGEWNTLRADAIEKTEAADTAAQNANEKATEASRVNAYLSGTVIHVTDRNGQETTANLKGETGDAAGFGTPTATIDGNIGTPSVTVTATGSDTAKEFAFAFSNLKGEKGDGLNWETMTEEDKEAVINSTAEKVEEDMIFASVQTCEDIIDELT